MPKQTIAERLKNHLLQHGPINCYVYDLAHAIGASFNSVNVTLWDIRRNAWRTGWTVPYQPPGPGPKTWCVVDGSTMTASEWRDIRGLTVQTLMVTEHMGKSRRTLVALLAQAAPSSVEAAAAQAALIQMDAAIASMQMTSTIL